MDLSLYGNLIYDELLIIDSPLVSGESHNCVKIEEKIGGLANFCRAFPASFPVSVTSSVGDDSEGHTARTEIMFRHPYSFIDVVDVPTSKATVIVDTHTNSRTGIVKWGACRAKKEFVPVPASWHHIMYLDRINVDLSKFQGIVSVDFCDSNSVFDYYDELKHVDYLIISETKMGLLADFNLPVKKGVIVHSPTQSYVINNGAVSQHNRNVSEHGLNVVGAGDYFAARCIANIMTDGGVDLAAVHSETLQLLRNQS